MKSTFQYSERWKVEQLYSWKVEGWQVANVENLKYWKTVNAAEFKSWKVENLDGGNF